MYDAVVAETVTITSGDGTPIEAYSARPMIPGPIGGVIVIHHLPGYDRETKEYARTLAVAGFNAVVPNLYWREAPGAEPDDAVAAARQQGVIPLSNERVVADASGAAAYLRGLSNSNGKVGVIGHCSGGYHSFLVGTSIPVDAVVDCYGGWITNPPPGQHPLAGVPQLLDRVPLLQAPILGLFGLDDASPNPENVATLEEALKNAGKTYEFHSYEGAGHAFFSVDKPSYRPEAAVDGWKHIRAWFGRYLEG
jgi:carboxymethylenebutenolidase